MTDKGSKSEFNIGRFLDRPNELKTVPVELIDADFSRNKRVEYGDIPWLAKSIIVNGLKIPLVLYAEACSKDHPKAIYYSGSKQYPAGYYRLLVQDGHRRYKAIRYAIDTLGSDIPSVSCRGTSKTETQEERLLNQLLMNSGKGFEPIETQAVFRELHNLGWSEETIAERANCTVVHVKRMLELSTAEDLTKYMVERGEISASLVLETLGDVRQIASLEGKREAEIYAEIAEFTPTTLKGGVSAKKFKENLNVKKEVLLSKDDPRFFFSVSSDVLLKRISQCIAVELGIEEDVMFRVMIPSRIWLAVKERYKGKGG